MPILQARGRVITFRLSPQEYQTVHSICEMAGVRSVSEFVRGAVLERAARLAGSRIGDVAAGGRASEPRLEEIVRLLQAQIEELSERIGLRAAKPRSPE